MVSGFIKDKRDKVPSAADYLKNEEYLTAKHREGLRFVSYGWNGYQFEQDDSNDYVYFIDFYSRLNRKDYDKRRQEMENIGWEFVSAFYQWQYFRKRAEDSLAANIEKKVIRRNDYAGRKELRSNLYVSLSGALSIVYSILFITDINRVWLISVVCFLAIVYLLLFYITSVKLLYLRRIIKYSK